MQHMASYTDKPKKRDNDWANIKRMVSYIWHYKGRTLSALLILVLSKLAMVGVPLVLKEIIDYLDHAKEQALALPVVLLLAYAALKVSASLFNELRDLIFAKVRYQAMMQLSSEVFQHLHQLALRYHLERNTGAVSRDLERGTQSISSILNYLVFNIVPTIAEFVLVASILITQYSGDFALITFITVIVYIAFTLSFTEWRMHFRHEMNALDSKANGRAIDSLINYETVKYFNNEHFEQQRYENTLNLWQTAAVKSQTTMSMLNFGQGFIISLGVSYVMYLSTQGVISGALSLGDLVLINTMMLQLFMPLGFLGIIYRALKYAMTDMDLVFKLLDHNVEIKDQKGAKDIAISDAHIQFSNVKFAYQEDRQILNGISFEIKHGQKVAVVGPSGAGKSTLSRLLFRFYDVQQGSISIDGQNINSVTQQSLRQAIGIVPQDTVLFNDTIFYNIQYANPQASKDEVYQAAKMADIHQFISELPEGYQTLVGERGLKLSGGEKQRVAIARVLLKQPKILIFDEATSSLDSRSEAAILSSLSALSQKRSTLVIAHRLSTIIDADTIIVMDKGDIVEQGNHKTLLKLKGLYKTMWDLQQDEQDEKEG